MNKGRLEAFSDGVMAIIITIMVLELKVPHGSDLADLWPLLPVLCSYALSFIYVGIYWNNHHHMMHATRKVGGGVMWANLHLLFWLSLIPVVTAWAGEHASAAWPVALYGVVLFMSGIAWLILESALIARNGRDSELAQAVGSETKGRLSAVLYLAAIGLAFVRPYLSEILYAGVALLWIVPDPRIERKMEVAG